MEPRAGNVELLDEFNILIICNSGIAEPRVADLKFVDQIGIENVRLGEAGEPREKIDGAIETGNYSIPANHVVLADLRVFKVVIGGAERVLDGERVIDAQGAQIQRVDLRLVERVIIRRK